LNANALSTNGLGSYLSRIAILSALLFVSGCELRQAMYDQEKYEPLEASSFFSDGQSYRPQISETV